MERLTNNKKAFDMSFFELAHNSCYADENRNARYRDYELDIDIRELVKNLAKDMCDEDLSDMSDEDFDEYMAEMLSVEMDSQIGLLALFYRNLWAMADLREKLKDYEDLEEQGRLLKLPCKVGDKIYSIYRCFDDGVQELIVKGIHMHSYTPTKTILSIEIESDDQRCCGKLRAEELGRTLFLAKGEAEEKLKELRGEENE